MTDEEYAASYYWECDGCSRGSGYSITREGAKEAAANHRRDCDGSTTVEPVR